MFSGIIESVGTLQEITKNKFTFSHNFSEPFTLGESIAISGMCATVIDFSSTEFSVEIIKISCDRTIFGKIKKGALVNFERSMIMGSRNSGHFVLGHVDACTKVLKKTQKSDYTVFRIELDAADQKYLITRGSIALNGISLTISDRGVDWFEVSIIPHTLKTTNLSETNKGDFLNIEFDVLGKYIVENTGGKKTLNKLDSSVQKR